MVKDVGYNTINSVLESWEALRRVPKYEQVAGGKLFQRLFITCPDAKVLFGFPIDIDPYCEDLLKSKRFALHSRYLIQMIDTALNMLGPDIELLTEMLYDLGRKHINYGVTPAMFPFMGVALIETLEEFLGDEFTESIKSAWTETYDVLSGDMIQAQINGKK